MREIYRARVAGRTLTVVEAVRREDGGTVLTTAWYLRGRKLADGSFLTGRTAADTLAKGLSEVRLLHPRARITVVHDQITGGVK
jgi:hypothetical protein